MRSSNRSHRIGCWVIIEKNAAATIDLQVDEAWRKHRPGRHNFGWPVTRVLITRRDALNHPRSIKMTASLCHRYPSKIRSAEIAKWDLRACSAGSRPIASLPTGRLVGPIDPL